MNVQKITAFKAEDGSLWEEETWAIHSNIEDIINNNFDHNCEGSHTVKEDLLKWFRDHPKDIKYIQANIKNLLPEHFGDEQ